MITLTSLMSTIPPYRRGDLFAFFRVFLIALPLSIGIAMASGIPIEKAVALGLITAIIGGIVVGPLSDSPLRVSGPAVGLAVLVVLFIREYGFETLGIIVVLAGLIQLAAGLLCMGQVFRAVSPALIHGMLAGIGILIFASQFHVMVDGLPPGTGKEFGGIINLWTLPQAVWMGISEPAHRPSAFIGLLTIATIMLWTAYAPKNFRRLLGPLIGVAVATGCAAFLDLNVKVLPSSIHLLDAITWPTGAGLSRLTEGAIWLAGLSLAFVASAESLLTATAVDAMQGRAQRTQYNRELAVQGVGNILCGFLGALPIAGVIVRSSTNVLAGGQTRFSSILQGIWILIFIALLPFALSLIPVAALAALLVYTGVQLTKLYFVSVFWGQDRVATGIYLVTLSSVVMVDLLSGIVVGIGLALVRFLYLFVHLEVTVQEKKEPSSENIFVQPKAVHERTRAREPNSVTTVINLEGGATFIGLPQLAATFGELRTDTFVHVYFHRLAFIDQACLDLLVNWERQHRAVGGESVLHWESLHTIFQRRAWNDKYLAGPPYHLTNKQLDFKDNNSPIYEHTTGRERTSP